jgi:nitrile hydratase accessory protein
MQSRFEHFAVTSMMGARDRPPRADGALQFTRRWERTAFGVALALSRDGHFEWEDFRQRLIAAIGVWENEHATDDPSWNYYDQWLAALESMVVASGIATKNELAKHAATAEAEYLCCRQAGGHEASSPPQGS